MQMRHYEEVIIPAKTSEKLVKTTCDLCGAEAKSGECGGSLFDVEEVEIEVIVRYKYGSVYPEGGWGTSLSVDICPDCFKEKLIPWLESQWCKTERKDCDF